MSGPVKGLLAFVGVVVASVVVAVAVASGGEKGPEHSGQTEADQAIAGQVASYLVDNGQSDHVTWIKVVQGDVFVYTDLDGSMPTALQHSKAVDICESAKSAAPNSDDVSVLNYAKLPIWAC